MFSNLSLSLNESPVSYPITDSKLPFSEYISRTRQIIEDRRPGAKPDVINANCPFELYPAKPIRSGQQFKFGTLLIHGLLDSPFSFRDIGSNLQSKGILSRSILLPGHGTTPTDLMNVTYHDWLQAVRYGVDTLRNEVEELYLIGYSTGATLSIYQALQDIKIAGIILLSPAIRIKSPVDLVVGWNQLLGLFSKNRDWLYVEDEIDYAKYKSIAYNAVTQVSKLTAVIHELRRHRALTTPMLMVMSREDETISSHRAIEFFSGLPNKDSKLLLYTSCDHRYPDTRILPRITSYPELNITHFSHASIPFAPDNPHYGENGDYPFAAHAEAGKFVYGAYNKFEIRFFDFMQQLGLTSLKRSELTYNPDFNFMTDQITQFIFNAKNTPAA